MNRRTAELGSFSSLRDLPLVAMLRSGVTVLPRGVGHLRLNFGMRSQVVFSLVRQFQTSPRRPIPPIFLIMVKPIVKIGAALTGRQVPVAVMSVTSSLYRIEFGLILSLCNFEIGIYRNIKPAVHVFYIALT